MPVSFGVFPPPVPPQLARLPLLAPVRSEGLPTPAGLRLQPVWLGVLPLLALAQLAGPHLLAPVLTEAQPLLAGSQLALVSLEVPPLSAPVQLEGLLLSALTWLVGLPTAGLTVLALVSLGVSLTPAPAQSGDLPPPGPTRPGATAWTGAPRVGLPQTEVPPPLPDSARLEGPPSARVWPTEFAGGLLTAREWGCLAEDHPRLLPDCARV